MADASAREPDRASETTDGVMGERPPDPRDDRQVLAAMARGDRTALRVLYERHAPWLFLRLSRRCGEPTIVEEVVQDTFVAVWRRPHGYEGRGDVAAWIWGIGIRRLIDRLRRVPLARRMAEQARAPRMEFVPSAEEQVLRGIEYGDAAAAVNRLSPELRAVLQATVLDGLSTKEASRLLGIPQGTVKTRLMRARAQLRESLA